MVLKTEMVLVEVMIVTVLKSSYNRLLQDTQRTGFWLYLPVCVCYRSFDFNEKKWRDVKFEGEPMPSARYGHSAVLYQVHSVILF